METIKNLELTGKCNQDFEDWHWKNVFTTQIGWEYLTDAMQYGVLVDFFDSVGIFIQIGVPSDYIDIQWYYWIDYKNGDEHITEDYKTRQEAREQAIIKANEIYNGK